MEILKLYLELIIKERKENKVRFIYSKHLIYLNLFKILFKSPFKNSRSITSLFFKNNNALIKALRKMIIRKHEEQNVHVYCSD